MMMYNVVSEKDLKLRQGLKLIGLKDSVYWMSWYICIPYSGFLFCEGKLYHFILKIAFCSVLIFIPNTAVRNILHARP